MFFKIRVGRGSRVRVRVGGGGGGFGNKNKIVQGIVHFVQSFDLSCDYHW